MKLFSKKRLTFLFGVGVAAYLLFGPDKHSSLDEQLQNMNSSISIDTISTKYTPLIIPTYTTSRIKPDTNMLLPTDSLPPNQYEQFIKESDSK